MPWLLLGSLTSSLKQITREMKDTAVSYVHKVSNTKQIYPLNTHIINSSTTTKKETLTL